MTSRAGGRARLAAIASHVPIASPADGPSTLLDDAAMRSFLEDGYVLIQPTELPLSWHAAVADRAAELVLAQPKQPTRASSVAPAGAAVDQAALWAALTPEITRVTQSPAVRGALTSILGPSYVTSGGGHMHEAASLDQFWHRDGSVG